MCPSSCRTLVHVGGNAEHNLHSSSSAMGGGGDNGAARDSSYIGDLGGLDDLRRATDERLLGPAVHVPNAKSVTIHPDVTEFRYPGRPFNELFQS